MIFWKHIKGLSPIPDSIGNSIYTFFRFSEEQDQIISNRKMISLPEVYLSNNTGFDSSTAENCGHLLTSDMQEGFINNPFTFYNNVIFNRGSDTNLIVSFNLKWLIDNSRSNPADSCYPVRIVKDAEVGGNLSLEGITSIVNDTDINITENTVTGGAFLVNGGVRIDKQLYVGTNLKVENRTESKFFNATSDYRAKKDFKLLDINALELIKKVQLYSFKYKESNQPSIGIIAQDVQDININGFELVDNKEASGANFDYMSIHESKLVYILWKAIQEQQKEIEELKKLIKD